MAVCQLKLPKPTQITQPVLMDPNPKPAVFLVAMRHIAAQICCRSGRLALSQALSGMRGAARGAVLCREAPVPKMPSCKRAAPAPSQCVSCKV